MWRIAITMGGVSKLELETHIKKKKKLPIKAIKLIVVWLNDFHSIK